MRRPKKNELKSSGQICYISRIRSRCFLYLFRGHSRARGSIGATQPAEDMCVSLETPFVASYRPATITLFGCLPPQVADFDEESKARHWVLWFALELWCPGQVHVGLKGSQDRISQEASLKVSASHCRDDRREGCSFSGLRLRQGAMAVLCLGR